MGTPGLGGSSRPAAAGALPGLPGAGAPLRLKLKLLAILFPDYPTCIPVDPRFQPAQTGSISSSL